MNDHCDSIWCEGKYADDWQKYVALRILEITCGKTPFLLTRYDTTTCELLPVSERTGMLDRKLKAIQADDEETWIKWIFRAYESTYGYELQGDNLLIARINLLVTFCDYLEDHWNRKANDSELSKLAAIISWNLWQMDGLKDTVPVDITKMRNMNFESENPDIPMECIVYNWSAKRQRRIGYSKIKIKNKNEI